MTMTKLVDCIVAVYSFKKLHLPLTLLYIDIIMQSLY
jgi:hypothetical protein